MQSLAKPSRGLRVAASTLQHSGVGGPSLWVWAVTSHWLQGKSHSLLHSGASPGYS